MAARDACRDLVTGAVQLLRPKGSTARYYPRTTRTEEIGKAGIA
jgi:hypothetical protein